jgi:TP901 family phage tail tape measure protein
LKQVAFEIVISDTQLKAQVAAVKKALASIKGAGVDIKLNVTKAEIAALRKKVKDTLDASVPIPLKLSGTANLVTNANSFAKGIDKAATNMQRFLDLMQKAAAESKTIRNNIGSTSGGGRSGNRINGGSRTGFTDSTGATLSAFSGFIRGGSSFTSEIGAVASGVGRLGLAAAAPVAIAAVAVKGLRDAIVDITEFGDKQAELASVLGTTREGITSLTEQAKNLGATMSFTATEIAGAQIELAKLGFTSDEVLSSTEGVARFAIVAGANIPDAAEAAGAALKSFELEATEMDRVVSVLGVSTAKSALDFEKLKVGIGTTFATAKTFGLEIEDVVTLLGELSNRGLSASVAATATRNILLNLADEGGKLRKTLTSVGVDEVKGLDGIIKALRVLNAEGVDLNTTFEITDKRSVNAFNAFVRGTGDLNKMKDSLVDVNDEFKIMEKERLNSLKGETILFTSALERLNLSFGGLENVLKGALGGLNGFLNGISDLLELKPGEAIAGEGLQATSLIRSLIDANDNYALRSKIIANLKIAYPDLLKNIDIEKATTSELKKLLADTLALYDKKVNISINESNFEKGVRRENELLDKQVKLLKEAQTNRVKTGSAGVFEEKRTLEDIKATRQSNLIELTTGIASTGSATVNQEKYLRDIIKQQNVGRGGRLTGDAANANTILKQIGLLRNSVAVDVPQFTDADFAIPTDGQLSRVEEFLNKLEAQRALYESNTVQADELSKAIKRIQDQQAKRSNVKVPEKDKAGSRDKKGKESPLPDSIDFLEAEYSRLVKEIDAVGSEELRLKLQKDAEIFKKRIKDARDKLKADLEPTDDEKIKLFNTLVDNQRDVDSQANKERFKDERVREAVELEQVKQSELRKILFRGQFQKKAFDAGLDKSGEYLKAQQEFANKLVELEEATGKRILAVGEVSREMEVKDRLVILRAIYKDEEDFAKAKESLFLELEAKKIEAAVKSGEVLSLIQEEQYNDILNKIKNINKELAETTFNKNLKFGSDTAFNSAFGTANADGKLSPKDIENLEKTSQDLKFEQSKKELEYKLQNELLYSKERAALQREYNELVIANQKRQYDDKKKKEEDIWKIISQGADIASQISDKIFEYERVQLDAKSDSELETIDTIYAARLKAAEGNASETERIEQEYQLKKAASEKKFAEQRRQLAIKEALINGALAVIRSFTVDPTGILAIVTAVTTGIQIATIRAQKFAKGGYTGNGKGAKDETGHVPVGIVHDGEYVVPKWQVRKRPSLIASLEKDRLRGYAAGGLATAQSGVSLESFAMMADIIAERVAASVGAAAYQGTSMGSEKGSVSGIVKVSRENNSRNNAKLINTF